MGFRNQLILAGAMLILAQPLVAGAAAKPLWYACKETAECIVAPDMCGGAGAVNRRYKNAYDAWLKSPEAQVSCVVRWPWPKHPQLGCVAKSCRVTNNPH